MADIYLNAGYRDRAQVKTLGARWDAEQRRWFVPSGRDLAPFAAWLSTPAQPINVASPSSSLPAPATSPSAALAVTRIGIPLSHLLAGVAQAVSQAYRSGIWTTVEVLKVDARRGHVYFELAERDGAGASVAQARAVIWADTANEIVPGFERATGVVLGAGIKLLVRAKPSMHALYGLSLVLDAIDPDYTLGDLEARKREIRGRLQREGVFDANRRLPSPWDYNRVLVVAPQGAAGLGDFRTEAERLERLGLCSFSYTFSRFQGEGAAAEIVQALTHGLAARQRSCPMPDAVAIIRGGGAVNDLAWLNDYDLARFICGLEVPVLTGIGHERDSTVLDEVANTRFDTPSKVIAGIEQVIARRVSETRATFEEILRVSARAVHAARRAADEADGSVKNSARRHLALARQRTTAMMSAVRVGALQSVRLTSQDTRDLVLDVRHQTAGKLALARQSVPSLMAQIRSEARQSIRTARSDARSQMGIVMERAAVDTRQALDAAGLAIADVSVNARRMVADAQTGSTALMREVAGQGPEKSLGRGFAIVRTEDGSTVTSAQATPGGAAIEIQFRDGRLAARTNDKGEVPK